MIISADEPVFSKIQLCFVFWEEKKDFVEKCTGRKSVFKRQKWLNAFMNIILCKETLLEGSCICECLSCCVKNEDTQKTKSTFLFFHIWFYCLDGHGWVCVNVSLNAVWSFKTSVVVVVVVCEPAETLRFSSSSSSRQKCQKQSKRKKNNSSDTTGSSQTR